MIGDIIISWDGCPEHSLDDDIRQSSVTPSGLQANLLVVSKKTTLDNQIQALAVSAALVSSVDQHPLLSAFLGAAVLSSISPVSVKLITDHESDLLNVILQTKMRAIIDLDELRRLLGNDQVADHAVQALCDKEILKRSKNGDIAVRRNILANIKVWKE